MLVQTGILRSLLLTAQGKVDEALANMQRCPPIAPSAALRRSGQTRICLPTRSLICLRKEDLSTAEQLLSESESAGEHHLSQLAQAKFGCTNSKPSLPKSY